MGTKMSPAGGGGGGFMLDRHAQFRQAALTKINTYTPPSTAITAKPLYAPLLSGYFLPLTSW